MFNPDKYAQIMAYIHDGDDHRLSEEECRSIDALEIIVRCLDIDRCNFSFDKAGKITGIAIGDIDCKHGAETGPQCTYT